MLILSWLPPIRAAKKEVLTQLFPKLYANSHKSIEWRDKIFKILPMTFPYCTVTVVFLTVAYDENVPS